MQFLATCSSILLTAALAGPAFAATTIEGAKVPIPTQRPAHVQTAQATTGGDDASGSMVVPPASGAGTDAVTTGAINPAVSGIGDFTAVDITKIAVMRVDEVPDDDTRDQYRRLPDGKSAEVRKLQTDIRSNPDLAAALEAQQVDISKVISVQQNGDGSVTFIVM
ncbi:hypothetical protein J2Y48_001902 [Mycoplana sp. BE70]|uniref:hypothetical protein n=1 Tax=Mycoplana sp. BE70 TaxID=2817775 RepID=UPI002858D062|nr:hypothetical protein [Mycoplana sp. BE70]MDR6756609.1 hypothetical protein [Mycoplana sp. BE70]